MWFKVIIACVPAAVIGLLFDDYMEKIENWLVVSLMLLVYGIAFIIVENKKKSPKITALSGLTYKTALLIGAFQVLSLVPGTSRSGATILGGMLSGVSRVASAEFSFFMAIPIMIGASCYKLLKFIIEGVSVSGMEIAILLIGIAVAYAVSLFCIKFLIDFVKRHSFSAFGVYRIILGIVVIGYFLFAA
jgi:undecaprenyl-diphosphatase